MANPRNIHLFNCDRTYKLDIVENWLTETKAKSGHGFYFSVKQHYFTLPQMLEMSTKTIPGLEMDLAVFVVHAHESRLSINEDNAGIGYAKIYKALQERTKGKVIVVIGGDDNYKDKEEEGRDVISRWARRKVSSQFSEEFMDGRKSFILSWDKKHRIIHEEALLHFLDPSKKEKKFEYQPPKREPPPQSLQQPPARGQEQPRMKPGETQTQQPQDSGNPRQGDDHSKENKTHRHHRGAYHGQLINERKRSEELTITPQRPHIKDPLRSDDLSKERYTGDPYDQLSKERNRPEETISQQRPVINDLPRRESKADYHHPGKAERVQVLKDLAVLGWNAKPEDMSAVTECIQKYRVQLNLTEHPDVRNANLQDLVTYLQTHPLKYCVMVVDAEKVNTVATERDDHHLKLYAAAETNVEAKIIVVVCFSSTKYEDDEETCQCLIKSTFKDENKAFVVSFKNGKLQVEGDELILLLTSALADTRSNPQQISHASSSQQSLGLGTSQPYAVQENSASGPSQQFYNQTGPSFSGQCVPQPHEVTTTKQPFDRTTGSLDKKIVLPPAKTVMVMTHLRNGKISREKEDIEYWKSEFTIPAPMERDLLKSYKNKTDVKLAIIENERGSLVPLVDKEKRKEFQQFMVLALDETVVLQTRIKNGKISFEKEDVVVRHSNWRVPEDMVSKLLQDFQMTPNADLFIISDSQGNLRTIVQVGTLRRYWSYINKMVGKPII